MGLPYPLLEVNRHLLVRLGPVLALLDTGCPFSFGRVSRVEIAGHTFRLPSGLLGVDLSSIHRLAGGSVDVLLGMDTLGPFCWQIDLREGVVAVSKDEPFSTTPWTPTEELLGVPVISVHHRAKQEPAVLDTGAKLSYIVGDVPPDVAAVAEEDDYNPQLGEIHTPVYATELVISGTAVSLRFGILPELGRLPLECAGIRWVVGSDLFTRRRVVLDFPRKRFAIAE